MRSAETDIATQDGPASAAPHPRVLIAAGGTGGHVYPAIAIADAIRAADEEAELLFVGTRNHMEWDAVPRAGYNIVNIWISGFHRRWTLKNLLFPVKLLTSLLQSFNILGEFRPQAVVSCGGYVAGPVGWMAARRGIPLVIQEQNSYPGVTNRLLAKHAERIFTAFEDADRWLPEEKTRLTGNPTRRELGRAGRMESIDHFDFTSDRPVLLVLGGSGGALTINEAMKAHIDELHEELGLQIIWQCGSGYFDDLRRTVKPGQYARLRLTDYLYRMAEAYEAADLVVSRAGALSCSELALTGTPSILIPSPNVAGDHQTRNARSMSDNGAAVLLEDGEARETLGRLVRELIRSEEKLREMNRAALEMARPDAAETIAREIITLTRDERERTS